VTIEGQRIACENRGGFTMAFAVKGDGVETDRTDYVPVLQTPVIDLATQPIHEGLVVLPDVSVGDDSRSSPPPAPEPVQFTMNGRTVYYQVTGTIWDWQVTLQKVGDPSGGASLPDFPSDVPVYVLPYNNWDRTIQSPGIATCTPRTADQVTSVCNWAKDHGYQVRPRGIMHG
jgi:hypothetical protein